jgi:Cu/Ag efflux protein CusF
MNKSFLFSSIALALFVSFGASAQTTTTDSMSKPGMVGKAETTTVTATIKNVDAKTRKVTLSVPGHPDFTTVAGDQVKNFAQLKAGDKVEVAYTEALVVELLKGGGKPVARTETGGMAGAKAGERPGGVVGRQVTVVGNVTAMDPATRHITVKGPQRTVEVMVRDPEQFKLIKVGDQLEATYVEAVMLDVKPAK